MYEDELQQIGLTEKEAKVYMAAIELGKASAQEISTKAHIKRPTTYFTIDQLMQKGLMSSVYEGKKQFFMAENPERLEDVFKARQDELKRQGEKLGKLVPDLKRLRPKNKDVPVVKYYIGKEGARSMVKDLLKFSGDEAWIAYPHDTVKAMFSSEELREMRFNRIQKEARAKALYTSSGNPILDNPSTEHVKLNGDNLKLPADIAVYGNYTRLTSFSDDVFGVVIEDKDIAESMKTLFKLAWEEAKRKLQQ